MKSNTINQQVQPVGTAAGDPFDLDISVLESADDAASLINLTDDGCGSSCPKACASQIG
ncbi:FxLD family lanthipeptide [Streptomyces murinus]|uniref:FxLD family lanthipeptide n=1 Tax=Streptomyces murinus TaxID=33900 RepID=UPI003D66A047